MKTEQAGTEGAEEDDEELKEALKSLADQEKKMGQLRNKAQSLVAHLAAVKAADSADSVAAALFTEMTAKSDAFSSAYLEYLASSAGITRGKTKVPATAVKNLVDSGAAHYKHFQDIGLHIRYA